MSLLFRLCLKLCELSEAAPLLLQVRMYKIQYDKDLESFGYLVHF